MPKEAALRAQAMSLVVPAAPSEYVSGNEAARDRYYRREATRFDTYPSAALCNADLLEGLRFLPRLGRMRSLISLTALAGFLMRCRDIRVCAVALLIVAYTAPYALSVPLYYRYRAAIEPMMCVLIGVFVGVAVAARRGWLAASPAQTPDERQDGHGG